jgi:uncharacterized protein (DUF488 family)
VLLDVRQRRGVRGSRYAFANSRRLQDELKARDIAYMHVPELAPSSDTRDLQKRADAASGTSKSMRATLTPEFVAAYERRNIEPLDWEGFLARLSPWRAPVLFCVERTPEACHRSLAATRLARAADVRVQHLLP